MVRLEMIACIGGALFCHYIASALNIHVPLSCNDEKDGCVGAISAAVESCAGAQCTVQLEAGEYAFDGTRYSNPLISISNAVDLAIVGAGSNETTLLLGDIYGTFSVSWSSNVTFSSLAIDSKRPFYTLATVVSSDTGSSNLTFDQEAYPVDTAAFPWLLQAQAAISFDTENDRYLGTGGVDYYWLDDPENITYTPNVGGVLSIAVALPVGQAIVLRHQVYNYNFLSASHSDFIQVTDVVLFSTPGMAVLTTNCTGVTLNHLQILKAQGRPMSITADGVHLSNSRGGEVLIQNCIFEGQGDDGINVPTLYKDIESISSDRKTLILGKNGVTGVSGVLWNGAVVNFFSRRTLNPNAPQGLVVSVSDDSVTLADPLPDSVSLYDLVNNAASYARYVEVSDCVFRANRARGALLKASNLLATRNVFDHCTGPAIKTETDGCFWFEGAPVRNWTVTNNSFLGVNYGTAKMAGDVELDSSIPVFDDQGIPTGECAAPISEPIHFGVIISDNRFVQDAGNSAVAMFSASGVTVSNNNITRDVGSPEPAAGFDIGCWSDSCDTSTTLGNICNGGACVIVGL
jgi:hypothetical protein